MKKVVKQLRLKRTSKMAKVVLKKIVKPLILVKVLRTWWIPKELQREMRMKNRIKKFLKAETKMRKTRITMKRTKLVETQNQIHLSKITQPTAKTHLRVETDLKILTAVISTKKVKKTKSSSCHLGN